MALCPKWQAHRKLQGRLQGMLPMHQARRQVPLQ